VLRRQSSETTNSLSVLIESAPSWGSSLAMAVGFSRHPGSRESLRPFVRRCVALGQAVSHRTLGPLGLPETAIGHESQIEPWSPFERRSALLVSEQTASLPTAMNIASRGNPNQLSRWRGRSKQIFAHSRGLRSKEDSGRWRCVFLDSYLYRTYGPGGKIATIRPHLIPRDRLYPAATRGRATIIGWFGPAGSE